MILLACCGGSPAQVTQTGGPPAAFVATPSAGDVQVATVDGRPVWGGCVADQIARTPSLTRQDALAQCIDLELLARAAEDKQLATDREVIDATRTALVRRLMDAFEAKYPDADSLRTQIDEMFAKAGTTTRPELRGSFHILVGVPEKASAEIDAAARRTAEQIYQKLANQTGLFTHQVREAAEGVKAPDGTTIEIGEVPKMPKDNRGRAPEYVGGLFAISEVGRVALVRTKLFGYHIILLTEVLPEAAIERAQVFAGLRRQLFVGYVNELMKSTKTEVYEIPEEAP